MNRRELIEKQKKERFGLEKYNNQGYLMKIIEYNETRNIKVMFLDEYQYVIKTTWSDFEKGGIKNPYARAIYGVAIRGAKYKAKENGKMKKEYDAWTGMLRRCYDPKWKEKEPSYIGVTCCKEWLLYENFYEWLHAQENFEKWLNGERWTVDKDILFKGNKIYSPETCCLVSHDVNTLFCKRDRDRGVYPLGVGYNNTTKKYIAKMSVKGDDGERHDKHIGSYKTAEEAFYLGYKPVKEAYVRKIAEEEYKKSNITEECYQAMINYKFEITD